MGEHAASGVSAATKFADSLMPQIVRLADSHKDLAIAMHEVGASFISFLRSLPKRVVNCNLAAPVDYNDEIAIAEAMVECNSALLAACCGVVSMLNLLAASSPKSAENAADLDFDDSFPIGDQGILLDAFRKYDMTATRPFLYHVFGFCASKSSIRHFMSEKGYMSEEVLSMCPEMVSLASVVRLVNSSSMATYVNDDVCLDFLDQQWASLVANLRLSQLMPIDPMTISESSIENSLPLLLGGETQTLATQVANHVDFERLDLRIVAVAPPALPQLDGAALVDNLSKSLMAEPHKKLLSSLQHEGGKFIPSNVLAELLPLYIKVRATMCIAAYVHHHVQSGLFVGFTSKGGRSPSALANSSGFAPYILVGITMLGACIGHLKASLATEVFKDLDSNGYALKTNIGTLRIWADGADSYF